MILRSARLGLTLLAGLSLFLTGLTGCSGGATGAGDPAATTRTAAVASTATSGLPAASSRSSADPPGRRTPSSGLPTVREADLPPEARTTLALIRKGGPFPYAKDGTVFSNFERVLPRRERGYYREYTVRTPGGRDRGPRRIVTGRQGETYYTDDHYRSFREVVADEDR
ncbi:ribonuclease domain-containing protein [Streptomyces roseicoloratus]|uniref:Ribonuclease domain-containing protein n=1 Tax=Streptomyces roseicoloratus TaxID=2508722 RepID=A0ABY9S140_9ACTN|nr:ribonuclease domain-containing protein [Streptomyces roseicoloratus]WMX48005.1 ribonuclease domain-containing protein [Streptomyces roseicoloratus]